MNSNLLYAKKLESLRAICDFCYMETTSNLFDAMNFSANWESKLLLTFTYFMFAMQLVKQSKVLTVSDTMLCGNVSGFLRYFICKKQL